MTGLSALIDLLGGAISRAWAAVKTASDAQAAADVAEGDELNARIEHDRREIERRANGNT